MDQEKIRKDILRELATFTSLFFLGLVALPIAVYFVGNAIFGGYSDGGFSAFYGALHADLRDGAPQVWFLVLSPYLVWQVLRLTIWAYRQASRPAARAPE